jgi:aspartyl protease family protein
VDAVVVENLNMPTLLGMSFLNRMDMRREGPVMTLTRRY